MKPVKSSLLFHPVFLLSLTAMVVNDVYAKYAFGNWMTGKLSDFAGLIVLPVFIRVLTPYFSVKTVALVSGGFFIWWKSELSQPLIDFCNSIFNLPVDRVVDYSDLLALVIIPIGLFIQPRGIQLCQLRLHAFRWALGAITFLSLCSTSMPYPRLFQAHPESRDVYFNETFKLKQSKEEVLAVLERKRISYTIDSVMYYPVTNQDNLYYRVGDNDSVRWQQVTHSTDSTIFIKREGQRYYLIPLFKADGYTFENVRFTLQENDKKVKTTVTIETFQQKGRKGFIYEKEIKKEYKQLFKEPFL